MDTYVSVGLYYYYIFSIYILTGFSALLIGIDKLFLAALLRDKSVIAVFLI